MFEINGLVSVRFGFFVLKPNRTETEPRPLLNLPFRENVIYVKRKTFTWSYARTQFLLSRQLWNKRSYSPNYTVLYLKAIPPLSYRNIKPLYISTLNRRKYMFNPETEKLFLVGCYCKFYCRNAKSCLKQCLCQLWRLQLTLCMFYNSINSRTGSTLKRTYK